MKPLYLELSEDDWQLLCAMARSGRVSRSQIVRWALRLYAISGGWTDDLSVRLDVIGNERLEVGPERRCV